MGKEIKKISDLIPDGHNYNKGTEFGAALIEKSIRTLGAGRSILLDKKGRVIAGNKTLEGIVQAGFDDEDIIVVKTNGKQIVAVQRTDLDLDTRRGKEMALADNATGKANLAWDYEALNIDFEAGELEEWGVFADESEGGIPNNALNSEAQEDDSEVPEVETVKTDIVLGDLFEIGPHRLLCGDSTNAENWGKIIPFEGVEIIYTDPPYSSGGYQESGKTSGSIGARGNKKIATDNLSTRGYILLMDKVLGNLNTPHTLFVFCDWKMWVYNQDIAEAKGYRVRNMIVWDKMQMGMGMPFRNQHELCLFGSKLAGKIGDGRTPNVLQFKRDREAEHATPKPVSLIVEMLKQVDGDTIADPFLGGGSTMVAAHQLNRKCYGMEIDPKYCQVIVDRMLKLDQTIEVKKNGMPYKRITQ